MINIDKKELKKLECIENGGCGVLYKNGGLIYKIYKEKVNDSYYRKIPNPTLKYNPIRINRLLKVDKKLIHTDLIKDVIFIDGKFAGVVLPFYEGTTLYDSKDLPLKKRIDLSLELVRNSRELTSYFIYPTDYKLNNVMVVDGHVKIIDLDDVLTKVNMMSHPHSEKECIIDLDNLIKSFVKEFCSFPSTYFRGLIDRNLPGVNISYNEIENYLEYKSKRYPYIILSENSDIYSNIRLFQDSRVRVIYASNRYYGYDDLNNKISKFNELGISIYDVILYRNFDKYFENVLYSNIIEADGNKLVTRHVKTLTK